MRRAAKRGAIVGLGVGVVGLGVAFAVASTCLPYLIARPPGPWPLICAEPTYPILMFLAFPVNLLTNDVAIAVRYAPLTLALYAIIGAVIARARQRRAPSDLGE